MMIIVRYRHDYNQLIFYLKMIKVSVSDKLY